MIKKLLASAVAAAATVGLYLSFDTQSRADDRIVVATYNVENLFDMHDDGTEYDIYKPYTHSWTPAMQAVKLAHTAKVIKQMDADIVALEEIESRRALDDLRGELDRQGSPYRYSAIADRHPATVHTALLSRYPIDATDEIPVGGETSSARSILRATVDVDGLPLILFVNHWKSKKGPESERVRCARALVDALRTLPAQSDYIVLGDFNSNYNENDTFRNDPLLNDTGGVTGINTILHTTQPDGSFVTIRDLKAAHDGMTDLWLQLPPSERWSEAFATRRDSLDHIILPAALFDAHGFSYVDGSFRRFVPHDLMRNGTPFRWKITKGGKGEHVGEGYSDHLPVMADFAKGAYRQATARPPASASEGTTTVAALYTLPPGGVSATLRDVTVIDVDDNNAVVKDASGRAVMLYGCAAGMTLGNRYDLIIEELALYNGLLEVKQARILRHIGENGSWQTMLLHRPTALLDDPVYQNEIVTALSGRFERGSLIYDGGKIKLYFRDNTLRPPNGTSITIRRGHISSYFGPQIVIRAPDDFTRP